MTRIQTTETTGGGLRPWLFRGLLVIGAGLMLVSWYMPWWAGQLDVIIVVDPIVMHPWGIEVANIVAGVADRSLYEMPAFFAPLMWFYLVACMAALLASLLVERTIVLGRFRVPLPQALIAIVGGSYLIATLFAVAIAFMRADAAGFQFLGSTTFYNPIGDQSTMTGALKPGYWLAVATGPLLIVLALFRNVISGGPKTS